MIPLQKLKQVSRLFLISGIVIVPISIIELYYGELYNSSILLADSFHGFVDATSAILFSVLLGIIYKRTSKFPWGLYNIESISILFVTIFIVYLAIAYLTTEIKDINVKQPAWLSIIVYVTSAVFIIIYEIEKRYSWISLVKTDLSHIKLDVLMEVFSGLGIILSNYYLNLTIITSLLIFVLYDTIRQFKEAIYSLIGVNYDSPIKERMQAILISLGYNVKNIYVRKIGSFYTLYVIIGLDPNVTLKEIYKIRKVVRRIGNSFDGVVSVEVKIIPEKSKKRELSNTNDGIKHIFRNKVNEENWSKYPSLIKNVTNSRSDIKDTTTKY